MKMKSDDKLMEAYRFLKKRGEKAVKMAKKSILKEEIRDKSVYNALKYFMKNIWQDFHHPGLLSLACEAVGGDPEKTTKLGASLVLLRGAIDVHDDIIDESITKASKLTVYGKFGKDIAILVGDALLIKSFTLLEEAIEPFQREERIEIINLIKKSFFEVGHAEAYEIHYRKNYNLSPEKYFEVVRSKAAAAEVSARLGAILGTKNQTQIDVLTEYGRALGTLMTIRDEFIDIFEPDEIKNRALKECLPLPVLYAFKDKNLKIKITQLLQKDQLTEDDCLKIVDLVLSSKEVKKLKKFMQDLIKDTTRKLAFITNSEVREVLEDLLLLSMKDL